MNKAELIAAIAAKTGDTKKGAEASVNAFVDVVTEALTEGDKVQLVGFGSFEVRKRAARKGRNPQTKEEIKIPASKAPVFKAGKALKDLVNKKSGLYKLRKRPKIKVAFSITKKENLYGTDFFSKEYSYIFNLNKYNCIFGNVYR